MSDDCHVTKIAGEFTRFGDTKIFAEYILKVLTNRKSLCLGVKLLDFKNHKAMNVS